MNKTAWQPTASHRFGKLTKPQHFDVVVVGGGISGLSAAYFLKQAGKKVCLLERDRIGVADTGHTTAHLTAVTDLRLAKLAKLFGDPAARLVWEAGTTAIDAIEKIVVANGIDCQFQRVPGYLHAPLHGDRDETKDLQADLRVAQRLNIDAKFVEAVPFVNKPGIRFSDQALFHPLAYLAGLARHVDGDGCVISEGTEVSEVESDPLAVKAGKLRIECDYVVIATHVPLMGATGLVSAALFQTKLFPYSSYVVAGRLPRGSYAAMSLWDTSDPYYYLRLDNDGKAARVILGGEDHKTGQAADASDRFRRLGEVLAEIFPQAKIYSQWSGQVVETNDGLPFIGETADRQFVATGFAGNGMTFGTLAGMMACDAALGRKNPWQSLFAVDRKKIRGGTWNYLKENVDFPFFYLKDRLSSPDGTSTRSVRRGEGKVLNLDGQRVACSRDSQGHLALCSATCTHMGCLVRWNTAEKTWDCPCHGSRFAPDGKVLAGPAETPLEPVKSPPAEKKPATAKPTKTVKGSSAGGRPRAARK
jgi:glycine/D-amino acid oxidase-like deaminating enzyme/nitrite reductase/ring-hydroxylating ferredoxin subunit